MKRLLSTEPDSFNRAKIRILFLILLFSMLKALVVIGMAAYFHQGFQLGRAAVVFCGYFLFLKVLLGSRKALGPLTHFMVWMGLILIWTNIFVFAKALNVVTIQFIFMLIVGSFYLLRLRYSIIYSFLAFLPAIILGVFPQLIPEGGIPAERLVSPGFEIVVCLNFLTVIITHYLFRQAFQENLAEKELLNIRLREAVKEATEAAESKSEFLSTMSHELRTPLNSVIAISELLLDKSDSTDQEENLRFLKDSATGLHSLINNILDFSKLGSGKLELEEIPLEIAQLFREVCTGLRFQALQKQISLDLNIDESVSGMRVVSDPTRLRQIIYNLVGNAIKFTEKGGVTVSLQLRALRDSDLDLLVTVKDTGIGIGADRLESIFDPFQQGHAGITRNFGGTGLGLAIVKRLLLAFNSSVQVKSREGEGSEFSFELNQRRASEQTPVVEGPTDELEELSRLRILVAEDNSMNRVVLTKVLSRWKITPVFALNGLEAVARHSEEDFDLILMDLQMPEMNGYQAAASIRKMTDPKKSGIRIIALSASSTDSLDLKIEAAGINGLLMKPFRIDELLGTLKEALTVSQPIPG
ncbi:MAG TPA: ATP-binding protein [Sphingobacteriaceae bacterium]